MSWLKLDDRFMDHPLILPLTFEELGMYLYALAFSNRNETDGRVPRQALLCKASRSFEDEPEQTLKLNKQLVRLLCDANLFASSEDGVLIVVHYTEFCDTRDEKDQRRTQLSETRAEVGKIGGLRSGIVRREAIASKQNGLVDEPNTKQRSSSPLRSDPSHTDPGERTPMVRSPISTERKMRAYTSPSALTPAPEPAPVAATPAVRMAAKKPEEPEGGAVSREDMAQFLAYLEVANKPSPTFSAIKAAQDIERQAKIAEQTERARSAGLYDEGEQSMPNVVKIPKKSLMDQRREWGAAGLNPDNGEPFEGMNGSAK